MKIQKYQPLINSITNRGWTLDPLIVITASVRATTHTPSMKQIETKFKIAETSIQKTFKEINTIATHYAMSIILNKRKIENNQPIIIDIDP